MIAKYFKWSQFIVLGFLLLSGCSIKYSFTGASISPQVKSYSIYYFPTRAPKAPPSLSDYFGEELRSRFTRQTRLGYQADGGDLEFEGSITGYDVVPIAIKDGDVASMNRLTVTITVKFTNNTDHEQDFETPFSAYADFPSTNLLSDVEDELIKKITTEIIDQIFNKSVANW